jgi:DNA-binding XRE family transcriptional regulator
MLTDILRRDRQRWGMSEAEAARRFGISLHVYREIEAGTRFLDFTTYDAICKLFGWPQAGKLPSDVDPSR